MIINLNKEKHSKRLAQPFIGSWYADFTFLIIVISALYFFFLGNRPLFVPDEGRYAEIAREMAISQDYITPFLNGVKYFEKPPLFYWLCALAIKIGGLNLWVIRSVNAFLALFGTLFTYITVRKLYDRQTGLLAALILGTSVLYFFMAHIISLDLAVTVFMTATLYSFLLALDTPNGTTQRLLIWQAFAFAALSVLTKGLIGIVFPTLIIASFILWMGEKRLIKTLYLPSGILIFLIIAVPWHLLVIKRNPEFFYFYFIEQHFLRYITKEVGHYQPFWFFIPVIAMGFFPWIVFLPQTLMKSSVDFWKRRKNAQKEVFLLIWASIIFLFFSFSKSKLIPYILPVLPPLAIMTAHYIIQTIQSPYQQGIRISFRILMVSSSFFAILFFLFPFYIQVPYPKGAEMTLGISALSLFSMIVVGMWSKQYPTKAIRLLLAVMMVFLLAFIAAFPFVDKRSILPLVQTIQPIIQAHDEVITFNQYFQDLPFYLQRQVSILNWKNELSYGMQYQDTHNWMINDTIFWQRWHSDKRVFVFIGLDEYYQLQNNHPEEQFYLLGKTLTAVLITNRLSFRSP